MCRHASVASEYRPLIVWIRIDFFTAQGCHRFDSYRIPYLQQLAAATLPVIRYVRPHMHFISNPMPDQFTYNSKLSLTEYLFNCRTYISGVCTLTFDCIDTGV